MAPKKVWVKLRDSRSEVFKVEVDERADFDDLKKAIKQRKTVRVASIFTEEYEEGSKCEPADLISSHGSVGRADTPFYFTIAPPVGSTAATAMEEASGFPNKRQRTSEIVKMAVRFCPEKRAMSNCRFETSHGFSRNAIKRFKKFVSDGMKSEVIVNIPIILLTGVPGTGKSMFSVYYLIKLMMDEEFPLKEVVLEHHQGVYNKITLTSQVNRFDPGGWTELELSVTQLQDPGRHLVFSDIITKEEPFKAGRWLFIFASPDPSRYRCTMKDARVGYRFTMPTWSEQELMTVVGDENKDEIYDRFVLFGGVPRYVLWKGPGQSPEQMLEDAIVSKGSGIMEYFSSNGHGDIDKDRSFMLVHLNPPRLSDDSDWDYQKPFEFSFASDEIFRRLIDKFDQSLLDSARSQFNNGAWSRSYGKGSAGHLFEKLVLWWTPIANKSVELTSLDNRANRLTATLPAMQLLPHLWEAKKGSKAGELEANCLYQPRITNLESADAFCVISEGEGPATLIVLQVTVGKTHPIKVNGLKKIVRAYPLTIQRALGKTLLVFVIPVNGALQGPQPLHTKGGTVAVSVPSEAQGFQQYVVEYAV